MFLPSKKDIELACDYYAQRTTNQTGMADKDGELRAALSRRRVQSRNTNQGGTEGLRDGVSVRNDDGVARAKSKGRESGHRDRGYLFALWTLALNTLARAYQVTKDSLSCPPSGFPMIDHKTIGSGDGPEHECVIIDASLDEYALRVIQKLTDPNAR